MSKNEYDEKDEKELRKHEEKSVEEKWQRDRLGSIVWALILIWAGFVLLAGNLGILDAFNALVERLGFQFAELPVEIPFIQVSAWSLIFLGAGVLLLAEVVVRLLFPTYRRPVLGTTILAVVFLGIGLGSWGLIWPLVLIVVGLALLLGGLFRRK
ncbi:MAG: hypothetical protein JSV68_13905 [Anaerolineaceae bacterium]|jgi:hypothetical protein|nr:hypothetical protein [Chloroflexota bacterium]UCC50198.1 MAG: hypothetical protein JSV68_13905 [Anaerolineaceae bacterium]